MAKGGPELLEDPPHHVLSVRGTAEVSEVEGVVVVLDFETRFPVAVSKLGTAGWPRRGRAARSRDRASSSA